MSLYGKIKKSVFSLNSSLGFTIIEGIIVFAIIFILTGIFTGFDRSGDRQVTLISERAKAIAVFERAKSMTLQKYREGADDVKFFKVVVDNDEKKMIIIQVTDTNAEIPVDVFEFDPRVILTWSGGSNFVEFYPPYLRVENQGILTMEIGGGKNIVGVEVGAGGAITPLD